VVVVPVLLVAVALVTVVPETVEVDTVEVVDVAEVVDTVEVTVNVVAVVVVGAGQLLHLTGHADWAAPRMSAFGLPQDKSLTNRAQPRGSSLPWQREVVVVAVAVVTVAVVTVVAVAVTVVVIVVTVADMDVAVAVRVVVVVDGQDLHIEGQATCTVLPNPGLVHMCSPSASQFVLSG
jgi:hypothetical protein